MTVLTFYHIKVTQDGTGKWIFDVFQYVFPEWILEIKRWLYSKELSRNLISINMLWSIGSTDDVITFLIAPFSMFSN